MVRSWEHTYQGRQIGAVNHVLTEHFVDEKSHLLVQNISYFFSCENWIQLPFISIFFNWTVFISIISWRGIIFFKSLITFFSDVNLFLKSIKCKRRQSRVIKMSVVVTEFMALVLILGVFWKYLVSYLVHIVALIQLRKRLSEKWVGSWRIHFFHPPQPLTHIYTHTHIPWC